MESVDHKVFSAEEQSEQLSHASPICWSADRLHWPSPPLFSALFLVLWKKYSLEKYIFRKDNLKKSSPLTAHRLSTPLFSLPNTTVRLMVDLDCYCYCYDHCYCYCFCYDHCIVVVFVIGNVQEHQQSERWANVTVRLMPGLDGWHESKSQHQHDTTESLHRWTMM